jgi:signal peptide peptidase SppA
VNCELIGIDSYELLPQLISDQWEETFLIEPSRCTLLMAAAAQITPEQIAERAARMKEQLSAGGAIDGQDPTYLVEDGIARIQLKGPISKSGTSFDPRGSSTMARHNVRKALRDPQVRGVWLNIESPGGAWAGTSELNSAVAELAKAKPVIVAGEEIVASGGYLAATSASEIWLNDPGVVGSIGVYSTITDRSKLYERAGLQVHLLKFGTDKGIGVDGLPITESQLAVLQQRVNQIGEMFVEQVSAGRRRQTSDVLQWATGRTYSAREGKQMGLIDQIGTPEEALAALANRIKGRTAVSMMGVKAMNYSEIVAACRGIDPAKPADAVFLAKIQSQSNLTVDSVKDAWADEKVARAEAAIKEANERAEKIKADADTRIAAATAQVEQQAEEKILSTGGHKAPSGASVKSGKTSTASSGDEALIEELDQRVKQYISEHPNVRKIDALIAVAKADSEFAKEAHAANARLAARA